MSSIDTRREDAFAPDVAERLVQKLGDRVSEATIEEYARESYRSLSEGARIFDFIPILGERDVILRLRVT